MSRRIWGAISILTLQLALALAAGAGAARAQDFYRGKTLTLVVGNTPGSGYDTYGRLVSRYMARHLPGNPAVVPQSMPGAGSVKAAEFIYAVAPKDGTLFGIVMPGALIDPLVNKGTAYRYQPGRFEFIGTADSGTKLCFSSARSQIKTIEDAQRTTAIVSSTARADYARMVNALAKTKFQIVTGYLWPRRTADGAGARRGRCDLRARPQRRQHAASGPADVRPGQHPAAVRARAAALADCTRRARDMEIHRAAGPARRRVDRCRAGLPAYVPGAARHASRPDASAGDPLSTRR